MKVAGDRRPDAVVFALKVADNVVGPEVSVGGAGSGRTVVL